MKEKPYNRIVLVGNGFDLALGLNTRYSDFILYYVKKIMLKAFKNGKTDKEDLISASFKDNGYRLPNKTEIQKLESIEKIKELIKYVETWFKISYKNNFIGGIISDFASGNWIDIEEYYFKVLIEKEKNASINPTMQDQAAVVSLNQSMDTLTVALDNYIEHILDKPYNVINKDFRTELSDFFDSLLFRSIVLSDHMDDKYKWNRPENIIFLNFNYTNTIRRCLNIFEKDKIHESIREISIHGRVFDTGNPIIFGYGDDTGGDYKQLEINRDNEWLRKIKSFKYPDTNNYHRLLYSLEEHEEFEVFIVGHSCGVSDKTLLKTIFEHPNCLSIRNYHYKDKQEDFDKRINISRHFTDKVLMRKRVLYFDECAKIPQLNNRK